MVLDPLALARDLDAELTARQAGYRLHDDYYRGAHRLLFASEKFANTFGSRFSAFADNWCDLVVDACEERLNVEGFRLGADVEGDREAWRVWQANQLDADSQIAHTEALVHGVAYAMVAPPDPGRDVARITVESPAQVVVRHEPGDRRRRAAALKRWVGEDGHVWATLYLPGRVFKFRSERAHRSTKVELPKDPTEHGKRLAALVEQGLEIRGEWKFTDDDGGQGYANPLGVVPVVPLVNRPRLAGQGVSEIAHVIPIQDAVNKLVADMLVASEFAAFRQRWVTGIELPADPVTGELVLPFRAGADTMFGSESPETKFGEFGVSDLQTYVTGVEMLVQHIASQTRTPPHYFYLSGQFPSGEALALDTEVATPEGWRPIVDLAPGDPVVDPAGETQTVVHAFPVLEGRPCYRVRFDDGAEVVADAGHRWLTHHYRTPYAVRRVTAVVSTEQIRESLTVPRGKRCASANHWIPVASPPEYDPVALPVAPYVLGCWLGDGSRGHGHMTCHEDDAAHFAGEWEGCGEVVRVYAPALDTKPAIRRVHAARGPHGTLRGRLAGLGILHEKRIPNIYLLAPLKDRLALLQGLMDTDGTVNQTQGSVSWSQSRRPLADDVLELVHSLGHRAVLRGGHDRHGWVISWSSPDLLFRLDRKASRQRTEWPRDGMGNRIRGRFVVAVEPVASVPVRCVEVTGDSHQFVVTRFRVPTHNSIKSAETGLVAKVRRKTRHFGEAWEEVVRLALRAAGSPQAAAADAAETIWGDPESRSESEHMDAVSKRAALGVPWQQLMEDSGYSPSQIERMRGMRRQEALDGQGLDLTLLREATDAVDTVRVPAGGGVPPPAAGGPY